MNEAAEKHRRKIFEELLPTVILCNTTAEIAAEKPKRFTLHEIKAHNTRIGHSFFRRDAMRNFGQRMRDFRVRHVGGRVCVIAPKTGAGMPVFSSGLR